jgi:hypothetical protein
VVVGEVVVGEVEVGGGVDVVAVVVLPCPPQDTNMRVKTIMQPNIRVKILLFIAVSPLFKVTTGFVFRV